MVQPPRPWPKPSPYDDALSEHVASGDLARVRGYFDEVFWEGSPDRPGWKHLRIALMREDRAMMRLLHMWGAHPGDDDMAAFRELAGERYPGYVEMLRSAGIRPGEPGGWENIAPRAWKPPHREIERRAHDIWVKSGKKPDRDTDNWLQAEAELVAEKEAARRKAAAGDTVFNELAFQKDAPQMLERVPEEWKKVLKAVQDTGAPEAVIAGGALRDLFNGAAIKDVDIFLRMRGGTRKNRNFLKEAFAASGLDVVQQDLGWDGYDRLLSSFPDPAKRTESVSSAAAPKRKRMMESWKIVAGPGRTEYNVIFVDDSLDRQLAKTAPKHEQPSIFAGALLESFDIGLCQIACDGREVESTTLYRDDASRKRISLVRPDATSKEHLERIVRKYPDWELNAAARDKLKEPAPRPPSLDTWY